MLSYCLKRTEKTGSRSPKVTMTNKGKLVILSKCTVCDSKKSTFIKKQEASGISSSLGIKTPLIKIPLVSPLLF